MEICNCSPYLQDRDSTDVVNYRPTNILPMISRIAEQVVTINNNN